MERIRRCLVLTPFCAIYIYIIILTHTRTKSIDETDLFKKGFVTGTKYTGALKTGNGVKFTAEASKEGKAKAFQTKIGAKYSDAKSGFSLNKFEINSHAKGENAPKPNLVAEVSLDEPSLPDFKFNFNVGICQNLDLKDEKAEVGVEYNVNKDVTTTVKFDPVNVTSALSVVGRRCCLIAGVEATAASSNASFDMETMAYDYSLFAGYDSADLRIVGRHNKKKNQCGLSVFQKYSPSLALGAIGSFDCANCKKGGDYSKAVGMKFGAKYALDTNSSLSANLGQDATLKLGYSQKLYPNVKITGTATVDLKTKSGSVSDPTSSFGFQMDFGDI